MKLLRSHLVFWSCSLFISFYLISCSNLLNDGSNSVSVELPKNLYGTLTSRSVEEGLPTDSFVLKATLTGNVNQTKTLEITDSSQSVSLEFTDIPLNSQVTVKIEVYGSNILIYSGSSETTTVDDKNVSLSITLSPNWISVDITPEDTESVLQSLSLDGFYKLVLKDFSQRNLYNLNATIKSLFISSPYYKLTLDLSEVTDFQNIEDGYFSYNDNLIGVIIPDSVTSIDLQSFICSQNLKSITIPGSVESIGELAFQSCIGLKSVNILEGSLTEIGVDAFSLCSSLETINIPSTVTTIGDSAFAECTNLKSIIIPANVTSIGDSAFAECTNLKSIIIPASVESIGSKVFDGCTLLEEISFEAPDGWYKYDSKDPTYVSVDLPIDPKSILELLNSGESFTKSY